MDLIPATFSFLVVNEKMQAGLSYAGRNPGELITPK